MCNCKNWVRDWRETIGGKYPKSEHAPGCEDYKPEFFARVEHDGSFCVMEVNEAADMVEGGDGEYTVTPVMLTRDQFERMPEFSGF